MLMSNLVTRLLLFFISIIYYCLCRVDGGLVTLINELTLVYRYHCQILTSRVREGFPS